MFPADPLFVFAFIRTLLDVLQEYLGDVTAGSIRDNFDIVYQVRNNHTQSYLCINLLPSAAGRNAGQRVSTDDRTQRVTRHRHAPFVLQEDTCSRWYRWVSPVLRL